MSKAMAIITHFGNLTEDFRCPVCLEIFQGPVLLPCRHSLCNGCAEKLIKAGILICPLDQKKHILNENDLKPNFHLSSIIEKYLSVTSSLMDGSSSALMTDAKADYSKLQQLPVAYLDCASEDYEISDLAALNDREDKALMDKAQKIVLCDEMMEKAQEMASELQNRIDKLHSEVDSATHGVIKLIHRYQDIFHQQITAKFALKVFEAEEVIRSIKLQSLMISQCLPDKDRELLERVKDIQNLENKLKIWKLPEIPLLKNEVEFNKTYYDHPTNFKFGEIIEKNHSSHLQENNFPGSACMEEQVALQESCRVSCMFSSPIFLCGFTRQFLIRTMTCTEDWRFQVASAIRQSKLKNPDRAYVIFRCGSITSTTLASVSETLDIRIGRTDKEHRIKMRTGRASEAARVLHGVQGDFVFVALMSIDKQDVPESGYCAEIDKLIDRFNRES